MKKTVYVLLLCCFLLTLFLSLGGCGSHLNPVSTPESTYTMLNATGNGSGDGVEDNATLESSEPTTQMPEMKEPTDSNPTDLYASILRIYADGMSDDGKSLVSCEYVLYDIDSNGIYELLLRYNDNLGGGARIYTYVAGAVHMIGECRLRGDLIAIHDDGTVYIRRRNEALNPVIHAQRMSDDKASIVTIESWEYLPDDEVLLVMHTIDGVGRIITDEEYDVFSHRVYREALSVADLPWQQLYVSFNDCNSNVGYINDVVYRGQGISISLLFEKPFATVLGPPMHSDGPYLSYYDIEIYAPWDAASETYGCVARSIGSTNLSMFEIDGVALDNKNRLELIAAFGSPIQYFEYPDNPYGAYTYRDSDNDERRMSYHFSSGGIDYVLQLAYLHPDDEAHFISIWPFWGNES